MEALVIGSFVVDILVFPEHDREEKSVPARTDICLGGVGHNMARFLADRKHAVTLMTATGGDPLARILLEGEHAFRLRLLKPPRITSAPLFVGIAHANRSYGFSNLDALEASFTPEAIRRELKELPRSFRFVVLDANLPSETLVSVTEGIRQELPGTLICANSTSPQKAARLCESLANVDVLFTNLDEFPRLFDTAFHPRLNLGDLPVRPRLATVITRGHDSIWVLGGDQKFETEVSPIPSCRNTNGAGDCFAAAVMSQMMLRGLSAPDRESVSVAAAETRDFLISLNRMGSRA